MRIVFAKGRKKGDVTLFYKGSMDRRGALEELKKIIKKAAEDKVLKKEKFGYYTVFLVPNDYMLEHFEVDFRGTKDFEEMNEVFKKGFKYLTEV